MTNRQGLLNGRLMLLTTGAFAAPATKVEANASPNTIQVHMVVTVEPLKDSDNTVASLNREDVLVRQGKNRLPVTAWIPSRGEQAGLQLFILVDDTSDTSLGSQLDDLRGFIQAQPPTTWIGLGYMRNG